MLRFFHSTPKQTFPADGKFLSFPFVLLRDKTPKQFLSGIYHMGLINLGEFLRFSTAHKTNV
jgi:hypothetical protein